MNKAVTIEDVLPNIEVGQQSVIVGMLAKAGIPHNHPLLEVVKLFDYSTSLYKGLSFEEKKALIPLIAWDKDKFAAKLTFDQRCEILALHRSGVQRELLAKAYGVNRRTVTHIYNKDSVHYKDVREHELAVGHAEFQKQYLTQSVIDRVMAFRQMAEKAPPSNNKQANRKAGPHTVLGENTENPHRVVISWKDKGDPANPENTDHVVVPGWYFNDLDGDFPNCWTYVDDVSLRTSENCYKAMLKDIRDKL